MHILVVEDQVNEREIILRHLKKDFADLEDLRITETGTFTGMLDVLATDVPDVTILDLNLGDGTTMQQVVRYIPDLQKKTHVIVASGFVEALGASPTVDFLRKDDNFFGRLCATIAKSLLARRGGGWAKSDENIKRMEEIQQRLTHADER